MASPFKISIKLYDDIYSNKECKQEEEIDKIINYLLNPNKEINEQIEFTKIYSDIYNYCLHNGVDSIYDKIKKYIVNYINTTYKEVFIFDSPKSRDNCCCSTEEDSVIDFFNSFSCGVKSLDILKCNFKILLNMIRCFIYEGKHRDILEKLDKLINYQFRTNILNVFIESFEHIFFHIVFSVDDVASNSIMPQFVSIYDSSKVFFGDNNVIYRNLHRSAFHYLIDYRVTNLIPCYGTLFVPNNADSVDPQFIHKINDTIVYINNYATKVFDIFIALFTHHKLTQSKTDILTGVLDHPDLLFDYIYYFVSLCILRDEEKILFFIKIMSVLPSWKNFKLKVIEALTLFLNGKSIVDTYNDLDFFIKVKRKYLNIESITSFDKKLLTIVTQNSKSVCTIRNEIHKYIYLNSNPTKFLYLLSLLMENSYFYDNFKKSLIIRLRESSKDSYIKEVNFLKKLKEINLKVNIEELENIVYDAYKNHIDIPFIIIHRTRLHNVHVFPSPINLKSVIEKYAKQFEEKEDFSDRILSYPIDLWKVRLRDTKYECIYYANGVQAEILLHFNKYKSASIQSFEPQILSGNVSKSFETLTDASFPILKASNSTEFTLNESFVPNKPKHIFKQPKSANKIEKVSIDLENNIRCHILKEMKSRKTSLISDVLFSTKNHFSKFSVPNVQYIEEKFQVSLDYLIKKEFITKLTENTIEYIP